MNRIIFCCLCSLLMHLELHSQNLNNNLLLNYEFSNDFLDNSVNQFHANNNGATFGNDRFGNAQSSAYFDGNSSVSFPNNPDLKPQFPLSFSVWFKVESFANQVTSWGIVTNDTKTEEYSGAFVSLLNNSKQLLINYGDGSGNTSIPNRRGVVTEQAIVPGMWYHVVADFASPSEINVFINGCPAATNSSGTGSLNLVYSDVPGSVGLKDHSTFSNVPLGYFTGDIDDVRYYERSLNINDVVELFDDFYPSPISEVNYEGCDDSYNVTVNGIVYDINNPSGTEVFTQNGDCDSTVIVELIFLEESSSEIREILCEGEVLEVNGTVFDINMPTGTVIATNHVGCDSIINVELDFSEEIRSDINETRCAGDGFEVVVNGTSYNENNTTGMEVILSSNNCDSLIFIELEYLESTSSEENYIGCQGDDYEVLVNGVSYNESRSTGLETLINQAGCDSTVIIDLLFEDCNDCGISTIGSRLSIVQTSVSSYTLLNENGDVIENDLTKEALHHLVKESASIINTKRAKKFQTHFSAKELNVILDRLKVGVKVKI